MLNTFAKVLLVSTAFAPVLLTYAYTSYLQKGTNVVAVSLLLIAIGLTVLCLLVIRASCRTLERIEFPVASVKTADTEIVGFVLAYLLPIVTATSEPIDIRVLAFVLAIFFFVIWTTNSYHTNPLLGMLGYHFYEITTASGITFLLITRRDVRNSRSITRVVQLTDYMVLDPGGG